MNTTEKLEAITDRGIFELLVTSVLRKAEKDYATIVHTGINAQGEPIRSPLDGFCQVPGSTPARFILVNHTTTDRRYLERKWLSVSEGNYGDLIKAARKAQELRSRFSGADFVVILATNQHIDADLLTKVYKKADELNVTVDIWEQTRLADFLDNNPEGHWFRKQYLGIDAEMLSGSLLQDLCEQSLARYEEFLFANLDICVSREVEKRLGEDTRRYAFCYLVGESGFGKSIVAYRALKRQLAAGGYGLWAPADLIKECISLENAIDKVLRMLYPHLLPDAGKAALQLVPESSPFFIVVDDVNRTEDPLKLVRKLLSWSKPPKSSGTSDSKPLFSPYFVVCPVWPQVWGLIDQDFSKATWIDTVFIGPLTSAEGESAIRVAASWRGITITNTEANALASKMGNDPFLIGSFSSLLPDDQIRDLHALTEDVIEKFIESSLKEAASISTASYLPNEYRETLSTLSHQMLLNRRLHPFWNEIENWVGEDSSEFRALRELIRQAKLCKLTDQDKFVFRHDRIQEALLAASIAEVINESSGESDLLREPFLAKIIGKALLISPQNREILKKMQHHNILALVEAIRCFGTPPSDYHNAIIEEVKEWAKKGVATGSVLASVLDAVCWSFLETDSPAVLEITENFPPYPLVLLARLRNGCAKSGARYCIGRHGLAPAINDKLRDQVLEQARRHHMGKLLGELKTLLESSDATDEEREGALALAGFLGSNELDDEILQCWTIVNDKTRVLPEAIWAATQCCGDNPDKLIDPLMTYWSELPDEEDDSGMSPKLWIAEALNFALARGLQENVINYFITQCDRHESLRHPIACMCDRIDAPDALEFIVRYAANLERNIADDGFIPWTALLADYWDISRTDGRRLPQASLDRLKILWESQENDDFIKKQAFRLWLTGAGWEQIDVLRPVPSDSPLFHSALWKRTQLGDQTVVPPLRSILSTEHQWFYVAHTVWCDEIMTVAEHYLESFKANIPTDFSGGLLNAHYSLSKLLMKIPVKDAEELLEKYWGHLGYSPLFIQTALYVGTSRCLELADSSISRCPREVEILKHIHFQFGFVESEREKYLTKQHLDNLLPYLDRFGEGELWHLAEECQRLGIPEWSYRHLRDLLSEEWRKRYHPSDDELLKDLDKFLADKKDLWVLEPWLEDFDKRHDPKSRLLSIVDRWIASRPTVEGFKIAAACIQTKGDREDLSILDKYTIEGKNKEITNIKESVRYFVCRRSLE